MDAAQFQTFMQAFTNAMAGAGQGGGGAAQVRDRPLIAKHVRADPFRGVNAEWDDWAFKFKRIMRSMNIGVYNVMAESETYDTLDEDAMDDGLKHRSGELYDILCQCCTGEALSVIKMVGDMRGFVAYQTLFKKYNPKTMARGVRLLCEVTNPPKVKDMTNIETEINRWEEKMATLKTQFDESLSNRMKIAVFANMMPMNIQEHIYATIDDNVLYDTFKDKLRVLVQNRISANMGPAPMDIGEVGSCGGCDKTDYEEYEVDAVDMNTKCFRCQGYGHLSRECATKYEKGKGKGSGGFAKGSGKGFGKDGKSGDGKGYSKGYGKNGKSGGKGKGYMGQCFKCGQVGHKAYECTTKVNGIDEDEKDEEIEVGGVWMIGMVEVDNMDTKSSDIGEKNVKENMNGKEHCEAWKTVGKKKSKIVKMHNMFSELEEAEMIGGIDQEQKRWTRASALMFNVADVAKPLASAAKVCEAGNRIVLEPEPGRSYVENIESGERMLLKKEKGTYVFEVKYLDDGMVGNITLDSGAGVSVWPKKMKEELEMLAKIEGLNMIAANGTKINNYGRKLIKFKGVQSGFSRRA